MLAAAALAAAPAPVPVPVPAPGDAAPLAAPTLPGVAPNDPLADAADDPPADVTGDAPVDVPLTAGCARGGGGGGGGDAAAGSAETRAPQWGQNFESASIGLPHCPQNMLPP
jgi:hypothetical protein